jgi:CHAD domain-containing protein
MKAAAANVLPRFLAASLKAQRRRYRKRLERCQAKFSESAVHELRIQTRRLLALLDLVQALTPELPLRKTRKIFKRRLDAFDELRDTHMQLVLLKTLRAAFPEVRELDAWLRRRERKLIGTLRKGLRTAKPARLEKRLKEIEQALRESAPPPEGPGDAPGFLAALEAAFAAVATLRRAVRRHRTATIHRTRIAFKRYRYMVELLRVFLPGMTAGLLRQMRSYQTRMGDIQDVEVLLAGLTLAERKGRLEAALQRRLRFAIARRRTRLVEEFLQTADGLFEFEPARLLKPGGASPTRKRRLEEPAGVSSSSISFSSSTSTCSAKSEDEDKNDDEDDSQEPTLQTRTTL